MAKQLNLFGNDDERGVEPVQTFRLEQLDEAFDGCQMSLIMHGEHVLSVVLEERNKAGDYWLASMVAGSQRAMSAMNEVGRRNLVELADRICPKPACCNHVGLPAVPLTPAHYAQLHLRQRGDDELADLVCEADSLFPDYLLAVAAAIKAVSGKELAELLANRPKLSESVWF